MPAVRRHAYKEVRLQQMRSFCAVAKTGSQTAAARLLGVAQPTVWEQVHALEREFGTKLIERTGRACQLTRQGQALAALAGPLVESFDSLLRYFAEAEFDSEVPLTLASSPRILLEDLPEPLARFVRRFPRVRLSIWEARGPDMADLLKLRQADVGITADPLPKEAMAWLKMEPLYELDLLLLTPKNHPLARRRQVRPKDLLSFPLVNSAAEGLPNPQMSAMLQQLGVFNASRRSIEANFASVVRRLVEVGLGIGLVPGLLGRNPSPHLHQRSMSRYFGQIPVNLVWRQGNLEERMILKLGNLIKETFYFKKGRKPP